MQLEQLREESELYCRIDLIYGPGDRIYNIYICFGIYSSSLTLVPQNGEGFTIPVRLVKLAQTSATEIP